MDSSAGQPQASVSSLDKSSREICRGRDPINAAVFLVPLKFRGRSKVFHGSSS